MLIKNKNRKFWEFWKPKQVELWEEIYIVNGKKLSAEEFYKRTKDIKQ